MILHHSFQETSNSGLFCSTDQSNAITPNDNKSDKTEEISKDLIVTTPTPSLKSTSATMNPPPCLVSVLNLARPRPPSQRRGLLPSLSVISEVENPYHYKRTTKWLITVTVALAAAIGPMGSTILLPALPKLSQDLNTTSAVANLSVAMYMLSMAIFPLWWSFSSSILGRRTIYLVSFSLFILCNVASALSNSIAMLIVMRVLGGGAAASVQAVGAGTVADIWESKERGRAVGIFYLGPILGPLLAPIIGGALSEAFGWRSTQWFQVIYGAMLLVILTMFLPETLALVPSSTPSLDLTGIPPDSKRPISKVVSTLRKYIFYPLRVLCYLKFPAVLVTVYLGSLTFGCLYALNISVQKTFSGPNYNYPTEILGLLYLPNSLGYILASTLGGRWADRIMDREAKKSRRYNADGKLLLLPEDRVRENVWIASVVFPAALLCYGWTANNGVYWIIPIIANFFFGLSSMIVMGCVITMLTEFLPGHSSEGAAVHNFGRNLMACVSSVIAGPIIDAIGDGWLFTILGILCWVSSLGVIWALRLFGPKWRIEMDKRFKTK